MARTRYFVARTIQMIAMLWIILTFLFFFFRMMPGSITDIMVFGGASPEAVEAFKEAWGLNDPLYVQYWRYMVNFVQGNVGTSLQYRRDVLDLVAMRIFNTFLLIAPGVTVAYVIGMLMGTVFGTNRGSLVEKFGVIPVVMSGTIPEFFTSILLIIVFSTGVIFNWFPPAGLIDTSVYQQFTGAPWWRPYLTGNFASHYVLPFTAVVLRYLYLPTLIMRTSVVENMGQDFSYYHKVTGLPRSNRMRHIMKHSFLPVLTLYPVSMTRAISGLVLIETVFNWPGIGHLLVQAVLSRDYPTVQFVFFLTAAFVIIANYFVDIMYGLIDPRISITD